ncbi:MAG: MFS transporter, partial [Symploca sp. SIO3E6]|nr:MFS transporter [Caldora sp. SIO3E6]
ESRNLLKDWWQGLSDRTLIIFLIANVFFTIYAAQLSSTLPLYLANFVPGGNTQTGFSEQWISYFFVWHALLKILFQLPLTRKLKSLSYVGSLAMALFLWSGGFLLIWLIGVTSTKPLIFAIGAFSVIAMAEIIYSPAASALVGEIAPVDLRGIYFSLESECWAIGFLIGPALGGWALDHPNTAGTNFWLMLIITAGVAAVILRFLKHRMTDVVSNPVGN